MLKKMLEEDPNKRISIEDLYKDFKEMFKVKLRV